MDNYSTTTPPTPPPDNDADDDDALYCSSPDNDTSAKKLDIVPPPTYDFLCGTDSPSAPIANELVIHEFNQQQLFLQPMTDDNLEAFFTTYPSCDPTLLISSTSQLSLLTTLAGSANIHALQWLIEHIIIPHGYDINRPDGLGRLAIDVAVKCACYQNKYECLKLLLQQPDIAVNYQYSETQQRSVLYNAISIKNIHVIMLLLNCPYFCFTNDQLALQLIIENDDVNILQLMLEHPRNTDDVRNNFLTDVLIKAYASQAQKCIDVLEKVSYFDVDWKYQTAEEHPTAEEYPPAEEHPTTEGGSLALESNNCHSAMFVHENCKDINTPPVQIDKTITSAFEISVKNYRKPEIIQKIISHMGFTPSMSDLNVLLKGREDYTTIYLNHPKVNPNACFRFLTGNAHNYPNEHELICFLTHLISHPRFDINEPDQIYPNMTPIFHCAKNGWFSLVIDLMGRQDVHLHYKDANGDNFITMNPQMFTSYHFQRFNGSIIQLLIELCIESNNPIILESILERYDNHDICFERHDFNPIIHAAQTNAAQCLEMILTKYTKQIPAWNRKIINTENNHPLLMASQYGHLECQNMMLKYLMTHFPIASQILSRAIFLAAQFGHTSLVESLIDFKLHHPNGNDLHINYIDPTTGLTPCMIAAKLNHDACFEMLYKTGRIQESIVDKQGCRLQDYLSPSQQQFVQDHPPPACSIM